MRRAADTLFIVRRSSAKQDRVKCHICKQPVAARGQNQSFPFCSPRCRAVDLGKWLGEEYRVPDGQQEEQEDEVPRPAEDGHGDADA